MTGIDSGWTDRAAVLRLAFDRSFAEPPGIGTTAQEDLLAIRFGSDGYAIRLSEITGVFADKRVTRIPGRVATLLGVAAFRGAIVPVYSLGALLGHSTTEAPRWLAIASAAPVAFAIEAFESEMRAARDAIVPQDTNQHSRNYVREFVRTAGSVRPIVHLGAVLDVIKNPTPNANIREER